MIRATINGRPVEMPEGATVMEAAEKAGVKIPSLCYYKGLNEVGACRVCVVEIEGYDKLFAACSTPVQEGMVVWTDSARARGARRANVRMILAQHDSACPMCVRNGSCALQALASDLGILDQPYRPEIDKTPVDVSIPIVKNEGKCIKCMRCIQVCEKVQSLGVWQLVGSGAHARVGTRDGKPLGGTDCAYCGQCVTHCPTGALTARDDTGRVFRALEDPETITVAQVAPAVRAAWAEVFGVERDKATPGRMAAALRRLGFDYVFDTNFAADLTIMEEGAEFVERFTHREDYAWPMFTSCCPGWLRFIKSQYPEYTRNLSTAKSPQQMFGAVVKSHFAQRLGVDPKKLVCVSVMPCASKKSEAAQPAMRGESGAPDVDVVITTREFDRMLRSKGVNPAALPEEAFDSPLGSGTGAAVVFGTTGGVMDAALRSAYFLVTGENPDADAFVAVRGMDGWKEAVFEVPGAGPVRVAVASGLGNTRRLMEAIKAGEAAYDFVEIMACPGGCVGGGGQPIRDREEAAEARGAHLWRLDGGSELRYSHENPDVQALYAGFLKGKNGKRLAHRLLHTDHEAWQMPYAAVLDGRG